MIEITAALVKELRAKTGAGMMNCKQALSENDGDIEASIDWLRTQGLSAASKKSSRVASEGLIGVATQGTKGALIEVNAETDFVARNVEFQKFVQTVTNISLEGNHTIEELKNAAYDISGITVRGTLSDMIAIVGENIDLRRSAALNVNKGVVSSYMHNSLEPGLGKIGVLISLESDGDREQLDILGKQLAMHVAATNPQVLSPQDVGTVELEREKNILTEQARESGKPDEIIAKMVEGRLRKFFEEVCLLEQIYVIDGESKVKNIVDMEAKKMAMPIVIKEFMRFALGEGIEKKKENFAVEVATAIQG